MRRLAFAITRNGFSERRIPPGYNAGVRPAQRRRLGDDIARIFDRACSIKDQQAASDLLALLETWRHRQLRRKGMERRRADNLAELARRRPEAPGP